MLPVIFMFMMSIVVVLPVLFMFMMSIVVVLVEAVVVLLLIVFLIVVVITLRQAKARCQDQQGSPLPPTAYQEHEGEARKHPEPSTNECD